MGKLSFSGWNQLTWGHRAKYRVHFILHNFKGRWLGNLKKKKKLIKDLFIQSFQMIFYRTESLYGKRERERDLVTIKWHLLNFYWFWVLPREPKVTENASLPCFPAWVAGLSEPGRGPPRPQTAELENWLACPGKLALTGQFPRKT